MKCKEMAQAHNVTAMQIGRLRKQFAPDEEGELSDQSIEFINTYFDELRSDESLAEMVESVKPAFVDSVCSYTQEGRHEVECKIQSDGGIKTVRALIPFSQKTEHLRGKPMRLEVIEFNDVEYYRHATLAGKAWNQS